jgi:MerR family copper efflux transcriptional regulator
LSTTHIFLRRIGRELEPTEAFGKCTLKIHELTVQSGITARQIRFLIAEGFVPPPTGATANADYGHEHLAAIRRYQHLHGLGYPPAAVKLLLQTDAAIPIRIVPGITLNIQPSILQKRMDVNRVMEKIFRILSDLFPPD